MPPSLVTLNDIEGQYQGPWGYEGLLPYATIKHQYEILWEDKWHKQTWPWVTFTVKVKVKVL